MVLAKYLLSLRSEINPNDKLINQHIMEQTLVLIKPSGILRNLIGDIIARFQNKGLVISGLKMMQARRANTP